MKRETNKKLPCPDGGTTAIYRLRHTRYQVLRTVYMYISYFVYSYFELQYLLHDYFLTSTNLVQKKT